jgi:transposase InsO family protein
MDWSSRYVLSWKLSNSMDEAFCVECLENALEAEGVSTPTRAASLLVKPSPAYLKTIR